MAFATAYSLRRTDADLDADDGEESNTWENEFLLDPEVIYIISNSILDNNNNI